MKSNGEASDPASGFVHQALIYSSDEEFLDVALPFVEGAVSAEEPALVAVQERNVENLRSALDGAPPGVTLLSVEQWYETSARTRDKFARWVAEKVRRDMGERNRPENRTADREPKCALQGWDGSRDATADGCP